MDDSTLIYMLFTCGRPSMYSGRLRKIILYCLTTESWYLHDYIFQIMLSLIQTDYILYHLDISNVHLTHSDLMTQNVVL